MKYKCNYIYCAAGMGLAGLEQCPKGGDPQDPNCSKFVDEDEFLEKWEREDENRAYKKR